MPGQPQDILSVSQRHVGAAFELLNARTVPDEQRLERLREARWELLQAVSVIEKGLALAATLERVARG